MKGVNLNILLLLLITSFGFNCFAQYNSVKVDILAPSLSRDLYIYQGSFERNFPQKYSIIASVGYGKYSHSFFNSATGPVEYSSVKGWSFIPEFRYYFFAKKDSYNKGFFTGIHFRYRYLTEKVDYPFPDRPINRSTKGSFFDYGPNIGYKNYYKRFLIETLLGYGHIFGSWNQSNERDQYVLSSQNEFSDKPTNAIRLEISVGFIFPKPVARAKKKQE
jgi:hypothetical protein